MQVTMDLGLVISHDALHYREPIPEFRLVPALEEQAGVGHAEARGGSTTADTLAVTQSRAGHAQLG